MSKKRKFLVDARKEKNMTQEQVAKQAGIARTTYTMIENGERSLSVEVAKKISIVLEIEWTLFFC